MSFAADRDASVAPTARLDALLTSSAYLSYAYSYPHKTAYRALAPAVDLRAAWAGEDRSALFLYVHVPFCEQRCGFCNLFTQVQPRDGLPAEYVAAVERQADVLGELLAPARFAQLAVGGGTPTFLAAPLLDRLLGVARRLGATGVPTSVEISPATFDDEKLAVLAAHGTTRVSMGVQSFTGAETSAVQRRQELGDVERALDRLRGVIATRNVDLIYGLPGQSAASLCASIDRALALDANELYLYPLYVRPLTILGRKEAWRDERLTLYRAGRDHLRARGWQQRSMRLFCAPDAGADGTTAPVRYRCQDDGMVGLGAGARSYTRSLHYASPFAVSQASVRGRIAEWIAQPPGALGAASHGFVLDGEEQRRRYVLLCLLDSGLDRAAYRHRFGGDALAELPALQQLIDLGLARVDDGALALTDAGVERADVLGHWLQSAAVQRLRADWSGE